MYWSKMDRVEYCGYNFFVMYYIEGEEVEHFSDSESSSSVNVYCMSEPGKVICGTAGFHTKYQLQKQAEEIIKKWVESFEDDDSDLPTVCWSK